MKKFLTQEEEYKLYKVPVPPRTKTYSPVAHRDIIEITEEHLATKGYRVNTKNYTVSNYGNQVVAKWGLESPIGSNTMEPMLVFKNSYDKSMSLGYAVGTQVFICSNGCVSGDIGVVRRKHTGNIREELGSSITGILTQLESTFNHIKQISKIFETKELGERLTAELIGRLYLEDRILSSTELNIVAEELRKPTFAEFKDPNAWSLYNHCTYALKHSHPLQSIEKHIKLTKFFEAEFINS